MAQSFLATRVMGALRPVDDRGADAVRQMGQGEIVEVTIKRKRHVRRFRLFWATMSKVHENVDHLRYPTVEDLVASFKIMAGVRTPLILPDGTRAFVPGSIAFHKMTEGEFQAFMDRCFAIIREHFLPGVSNEDLRREVAIMIGEEAA